MRKITTGHRWKSFVLGYDGDIPIYGAVDDAPLYFAKTLAYAPFYVYPDGHTSITGKNSTDELNSLM